MFYLRSLLFLIAIFLYIISDHIIKEHIYTYLPTISHYVNVYIIEVEACFLAWFGCDNVGQHPSQQYMYVQDEANMHHHDHDNRNCNCVFAVKALRKEHCTLYAHVTETRVAVAEKTKQTRQLISCFILTCADGVRALNMIE